MTNSHAMSKAVEVRTAKELCLKEQPTQKLQTVHANEKSGEVSWGFQRLVLHQTSCAEQFYVFMHLFFMF